MLSIVRRPIPERTMLLICDIQEKFRPLVFNMESVIHKSELLNKACNALGIDALITEHYPSVMGPTVPEITRFSTTKILSKTDFSMITQEVAAEIHSTREHIILCGIESHVCVLQTALDLVATNRNVYLVCDAVSSQRSYDRSIAIQRLQQAGVVLTTTESILFDLMRCAKHPNFKQVSALLKAHKDIDVTLPKFEA